MEITGDLPPLWPQLSNSGPRRRPPPPLFTPPVLIILLPIIALLVLFFALPPFLSITTQIIRPGSVRKTSDSLTIFLVFSTILCGVFAKRNDDVEDNTSSTAAAAAKNSSVIRNYSDNVNGYDDINDRPSNTAPFATGVRRLKRSSSSYPDLMQETLWGNHSEDRFRFLDDLEINKSSSSSLTNYNDQVHELRRSRRRNDEYQFEESEAKVIPVDTFVLHSSPSSSPPSTKAPVPPSTPPPPASRHRPKRTYQAVGQKEKVINVMTPKSAETTPPAPPPPPPRRPPSPLVQMENRSERKYSKLERRKSNATKEIKMVFASLRKRNKKNKQKSKDHDHHQHQVCPLDSPTETSSSPPYYYTTIPPPSPPLPPPPLPPPPSSVFQKYYLFRKGSKTKRPSVPAPPPPPPPFSRQKSEVPAPPPPFFSTKRLSKQKSQIIPPPSKPPPAPPTPPPEPSSRRRTPTNDKGRPPLPTKSNTNNYYEENVINSGGQSPLIPMAPPPPPFKMTGFKFVVRGDFVKIQSSPSSRCSSPDLEEVDDVSSSKDDTETVSLMDGNDAVGVGGRVPVFCPSPDVNAKAETFIARLRDGWKLEKINSMKEKQKISD